MKKRLTGLAFVFIALLIGVCAIGSYGMRFVHIETSEELASARLESILDAIKERDQESIKEMFSQQAKDEADGLDDQIDYLFSLINDDISSWEQIGGHEEEANDYGHEVLMIRYRYHVNIGDTQYLFQIYECIKNTDSPQKIGLYSLKVVPADREEPVFRNAGIYVPEKE